MIFNTFNLERFIEKQIGGFDDSVYVVNSNINSITLSINSVFDWEKLTDDIEKEFKQTDFSFTVVGLDLIISWR